MADESEQGFTLAQIFEESEAPKQDPIEETPTPEAPKQDPIEKTPQKPIDTEGKSAYRLFRERISQYASREEARKHYKEIAAELGVHVSLGYKAEKKVKQWRTQKQSAKVPTFSIPQEEIDEPTEPPEKTPIYTPFEAPAQEAAEFTPQPQQSYIQPSFTDVTEKLNEVIQHQAPKCLNHVFEILGSRTGIGTGDGEQFLDKQDSADLAILLPVVVKKVTGGTMNAETTENVAIGAFAAQLTLKGLKNKLKGQPVKKQPEPEPKPEPNPDPKPEPKQKTEVITEQKPDNAQIEFKDNRPKWEKQLN